MASERWKLDLEDAKSIWRHVAIPLVAGGAVAALQAVQAGATSLKMVGQAALTAVVAGGIQLLNRWTSNHEQG